MLHYISLKKNKKIKKSSCYIFIEIIIFVLQCDKYEIIMWLPRLLEAIVEKKLVPWVFIPDANMSLAFLCWNKQNLTQDSFISCLVKSGAKQPASLLALSDGSCLTGTSQMIIQIGGSQANAQMVFGQNLNPSGSWLSFLWANECINQRSVSCLLVSIR